MRNEIKDQVDRRRRRSEAEKHKIPVWKNKNVTKRNDFNED